MLIENQLIEIQINNKNLKYYNSLGYNTAIGETILVPIEHLTKGSHAIVDLVCDVCGKPLKKPYYCYLDQHTHNMDVCRACKNKKTELTNLEKYGVGCVFQSEQIKGKIKETNLEKYGVENPFASDMVKNKIKNFYLNNYGVEYNSQTDDFLTKTKQTCLKRYGVENPQQNPKIKEKATQTMLQNGMVKTSQQQLQIYEMIKEKYPNAELNYPFSYCILDIFLCINNVKIDVEYDGWFWHQDQLSDLKRDKFLRSKDFKVIRVRSGHLIPTEKELFDTIDYLVNTEHSFKEIMLSDWKTIDQTQQND